MRRRRPCHGAAMPHSTPAAIAEVRAGVVAGLSAARCRRHPRRRRTGRNRAQSGGGAGCAGSSGRVVHGAASAGCLDMGTCRDCALAVRSRPAAARAGARRSPAGRRRGRSRRRPQPVGAATARLRSTGRPVTAPAAPPARRNGAPQMIGHLDGVGRAVGYPDRAVGRRHPTAFGGAHDAGTSGRRQSAREARPRACRAQGRTMPPCAIHHLQP
jgi:hypothetical protein